jgi:hypothetical protein
MALAQQDLDAYAQAMAQPNGWRRCLTIEEAWDLDGYPPAVVSEVLSSVADGCSFDDALETALSSETPWSQSGEAVPALSAPDEQNNPTLSPEAEKGS